MSPEQRLRIRAEAAREVEKGEPLMLIDGLMVMDLCDQIARLETKLAAVEAYGELHDATP